MQSTIKRYLVCILLCLAIIQLKASEPDSLEKALPQKGLEIGIAALMPAAPSLAIAYTSDKWGIRATGMYWGRNTSGYQLTTKYAFGGKNDHSHWLGVVGGESQDPGCDYFYVGPAYEFRYKRFYAEGGISKVVHVNRGDFSDLPFWIILQIGYVWHIGK